MVNKLIYLEHEIKEVLKRWQQSLTEFGISSPLLSWFKSYLSYRDRHVVIVYKNGEGELMRSTRMQKRANKQDKRHSMTTM